MTIFYKKLTRLFILCASLFAIISCSVQNNQKASQSRLFVQKNTSHSYELYTPVGYDSTQAYPVIFSFDSHGNGSEAIKNLKHAANKYGFLLVGSNTIRNGIDDYETRISELIDDVEMRYKINSQARFTAGFSGGARMANYYALKHQLAGVISCGAGFRYADIRTTGTTAYVINISGNRDCNMQETEYVPGASECEASNYLTLHFSGTHAWPDSLTMTDAVAFLYTRMILDKTQKESNISISEILDIYTARADSLEKAKNSLAHYKTLEFLSKMFYGSELSVGIEKRMEELTNDIHFKELIQDQEQIMQLEGLLNQGYLQAINTESAEWWKKEMKALADSANKNPNSNMRDMLYRVKSYVGLVCFSFASNVARSKDIAKLKQTLSVYELLEPENPDLFYYKALQCLLENKNEQMVALLEKSVQLGFNDSVRLKNDFPSTIAEGIMKKLK